MPIYEVSVSIEADSLVDAVIEVTYGDEGPNTRIRSVSAYKLEED